MQTKGISDILYSVRRSVCGFFENAETSFPLGHTVSHGLKGITCSTGIAKIAVAWTSIAKWSLLQAAVPFTGNCLV